MFKDIVLVSVFIKGSPTYCIISSISLVDGLYPFTPSGITLANIVPVSLTFIVNLRNIFFPNMFLYPGAGLFS